MLGLAVMLIYISEKRNRELGLKVQCSHVIERCTDSTKQTLGENLYGHRE